MARLGELLRRYKGVTAYLFFGVCTTLVNIAVYELCFAALTVRNVPSTVIAWLVSVAFAFVTNKLWVFESRSLAPAVVAREAASFFACRAATGALDVIIMYIAVDVFGGSGLVWKIISNVIVVILNYAASKIFIFKKRQ